ncbi:hypothetical protein BLA60_28790 [Actinophytocola xinjiangensis]|uniref:Uncharacterized protein n=1 Tax=Actinophytocola xinjiangensis TaxID=485602 RepID=A0A7Z1AX20_9PSEU|nr:hypothetical protein [Actinophytocola xinjiangensis]OLF07201.1 hypothetical protein BLA60_28790 [Actinophytocola xinjiangensis]
MIWDVPVVDGLDRQRSLVVTVSDGRVAVLPPPGEGFYLPAQSIWQLHEAIRAAALVAAGMAQRSAAEPARAAH